MSTYMSRRLFFVSTLILVSFILFSAMSYAQETETTDTSAQEIRPAQTGQIRENVLKRIEEKRTQQLKRNTDRKAEFAEKVEQLSDEAKKAALERIASAIETMNENRTNAWANVLDRLSEILERIKTKVENLATENSDVAAVEELITSAETSISNASSAVETQAQKTYELDIEDEQTLGQVVRPVVQQFKQDLRTTLTSIQSARDAVRQAARGLAQINANLNTKNIETSTQNNVIAP